MDWRFRSKRRPVYDTAVILQVVKEPVGRKAVKYMREQGPHWLPRIRAYPKKGDFSIIAGILARSFPVEYLDCTGTILFL
jgi:hypothetical protein